MKPSRSAAFAVIGGAMVLAIAVLAFFIFALPRISGSGIRTAPSQHPVPETSISPSELPSVIESPSVSPGPNESATPSPKPPPDTATVMIVFADWDPSTKVLETSGYVADVIEDGGICTLTATGPTTVTASRQAVANASTTSCGTLTIPSDKLKNGSYSVTLGYKSATSGGTSEVAEVTVQK